MLGVIKNPVGFFNPPLLWREEKIHRV